MEWSKAWIGFLEITIRPSAIVRCVSLRYSDQRHVPARPQRYRDVLNFKLQAMHRKQVDALVVLSTKGYLLTTRVDDPVTPSLFVKEKKILYTDLVKLNPSAAPAFFAISARRDASPFKLSS